MLAGEMREGRNYRLVDGQIVQFSYQGQTGWMIVHEPGETNMQSSFGIKPTEIVEELSE